MPLLQYSFARLETEDMRRMDDASSLEHELAPLIGEQVIIDVKGSYIYLGTLAKVGREVIVLKEADVHYCGDSQTTTELYAMEARKNGLRVNRKSVYVVRSEILSLARLEDIIEY
jgi:hypothetical protein